MMRFSTDKPLTRSKKTATMAACQALANFRISYEDRFFHVNRENTFATENTLIALSAVMHAFDTETLQHIKNNPELKQMFCQAFKSISHMLSALEITNLRQHYPALTITEKVVFGYDPIEPRGFEEYISKKPEHFLLKLRFLFPKSDGRDAFPDGIIPQALSQQAVKPFVDQVNKMLEVAFPSAKKQARVLSNSHHALRLSFDAPRHSDDDQESAMPFCGLNHPPAFGF